MKLLRFLLCLFGLGVASIDMSAVKQCYCSYACGPRDVKPNDKPKVDTSTGICFCQKRDKDKYFEHHCDAKHNAEFENSYCQQ